ncbi:polyamine ABC transporter ATP-binding protein [candidate division KSB3 bacterium]|uniref:Spermidine/putrescine import ATP-binding protein PotA n=1 Tax=candidate division KSB3 bacterium TaxID=2044937 RepID=A0A9D5JTN9_9BACT|nr:polyamine ABC transporter ATP-binding protein [candidate division KSB3 bacterium]MBD3323767.1 polyamine ABC transporter ATP-binding protein [candidate division KSB3 bacterium]
MVHSVELRHVTKIFGTETVAVDDVSFAIQRGEFFSLLGPSGCGKTTLLRMIAGFETPTTGTILLDGHEITHTPPYKRDVNMVFQNYALFPHMSVANNIAYGLKMKGVSKPKRAEAVKDILHKVKLTGLEDRKITQLSGGQQQRVALARALINQPAVLLLDEPLGALDQKLREQMQIELVDLQEQVKITFIFVTHDQREALTISDRIAVMNEGRVEQLGTPKAIYEFPKTRFVADFIGTSNFLTGTYRGVEDGFQRIAIAGTAIGVKSQHTLTIGEEVTVVVRPEKLMISKDPPTSSINTLCGVIEDIIYVGTDTRYFVKIPSTGTRFQVFAQNFQHTAKQKFTWFDTVYIRWEPENSSLIRA